jgi:hypothetical protein
VSFIALAKLCFSGKRAEARAAAAAPLDQNKPEVSDGGVRKKRATCVVIEVS